MKQLVGTEAAARVLYALSREAAQSTTGLPVGVHYLQNHHYIWVNREVEKSSNYFQNLTEEHNLTVN
jgi:hypothetical protein